MFAVTQLFLGYLYDVCVGAHDEEIKGLNPEHWTDEIFQILSTVTDRYAEALVPEESAGDVENADGDKKGGVKARGDAKAGGNKKADGQNGDDADINDGGFGDLNLDNPAPSGADAGNADSNPLGPLNESHNGGHRAHSPTLSDSSSLISTPSSESESLLSHPLTSEVLTQRRKRREYQKKAFSHSSLKVPTAGEKKIVENSLVSMGVTRLACQTWDTFAAS